MMVLKMNLHFVFSSGLVTAIGSSDWLNTNAPSEGISTMATTTEQQEPQLEVIYLSPNEGYIQTPGWDGHTLHPSHMDSLIRVDVPPDHGVMLSYPHLDLPGNRDTCDLHQVTMKVYRILRSTGDQLTLFDYTNTKRPSAAIFNDTGALLVHFTSHTTQQKTGFRLYFTFHNYTAFPEKLPDGRWNCSVPYWPDFKQHEPCDLTLNCDEGQDELDCPYTSKLCGLGHITVGGSCFLYVISPVRDVTWNDMDYDCSVRGGRLASFSTPDKWRLMIEYLQLRHSLNLFSMVNVGLYSAPLSLPRIYRNEWQWTDGTVAHHRSIIDNKIRPICSYFNADNFPDLSVTYCSVGHPFPHYICQIESGVTTRMVKIPPVVLPEPPTWSADSKLVECPMDHLTHEFLACDVESVCWAGEDGACTAPLTPLPPSFTCLNGVERIPYSYVCDYRQDCNDGSDENFCWLPPCSREEHFVCNNGQCIPRTLVCDGQEHCADGSDEGRCSESPDLDVAIKTPPPPAIVNLDSSGTFIVQAINVSQSGMNSRCPETHFQCHGRGYCMPIFTKCNGANDCPNKEDELSCYSKVCPGFYRCRASHACVHPMHMCDGVFQCPQGDDEQMCNVTCPPNCTCYGQAFFCRDVFQANAFPELRYLDATGTGMKPEDLMENSLLIFLNLQNCRIDTFEGVRFPNLHSLDLSDNHLVKFSMESIRYQTRIRFLSLIGNPLASLFNRENTRLIFTNLRTLLLSRVNMTETDPSMFEMIPNLQILNLSYTGLRSVKEPGFQTLKHLRVLDLRGCPLTEFPPDVLQGLEKLDMIHADNYKFCCPATLPEGFKTSNCEAPSDEISSCDALLRSDLYRIFLSVFAVFAIVGNFGSFVYRVLLQRKKSSLGFDVFVTHLCVSDFLMGMYLAMVGIADRMYQGTYLWEDLAWRGSAACKVAGFLSFLSNEVSAFNICLITLDRFLVLRFPFSQFHFRKWSAHAACAVFWLVGILLAAVPLLPMATHWDFYGQTGICIPLPVTRKDFAGHDYAFGVMIVLNFILFLFIAAGQVFIYWSIHVNTMSTGDSTKRSKDLTIARRLITVATTDFLCWFPIGLLGLLASNGVPVPGEVSVAMAIFILPLNSALNPFLYTINVIHEQRRRQQEERMRKMWMSQMNSMNKKTSDSTDKK